MSIAQRKQRHREDMRELILDAARSIFLEKGYDQTSIRNIAEKIEYSPGTIYLYFKEKDEIFHALHEEGFRRMIGKMETLQHVFDPMERLKAFGRVYLQFANDNKDFYDLMFIMNEAVDHEESKWDMGSRALDFLKQVIRDCQAKGHFKNQDVEYLSFMIWAQVHGMAALYCRDRCQVYPPKIGIIKLMENAYTYFVNMLEKS